VKKSSILYRCVVCGRGIKAIAGDAVHMVTGGAHCSECLGNAASAAVAAAAPRVPSTGRADAARARWAAMTPEQKAERVAKLKAGRKAQAAGGAS